MKTNWIVVSLAATLVASCGHDRELLGDVEHVEPAVEVVAESEPVEIAPTDDYTLSVDSGDIFSELGAWQWLDPYGWVWRPYMGLAETLMGYRVRTVNGWLDPFANGAWVMSSMLGWVWVPGLVKYGLGPPIPQPCEPVAPPPLEKSPSDNSGGKMKSPAPGKPPTDEPRKFKERIGDETKGGEKRKG